jgi:hypothetical protein
MDQGKGAGSANQTHLILPGNYTYRHAVPVPLGEDGQGNTNRFTKSSTPELTVIRIRDLTNFVPPGSGIRNQYLTDPGSDCTEREKLNHYSINTSTGIDTGHLQHNDMLVRKISFTLHYLIPVCLYLFVSEPMCALLRSYCTFFLKIFKNEY